MPVLIESGSKKVEGYYGSVLYEESGQDHMTLEFFSARHNRVVP